MRGRRDLRIPPDVLGYSVWFQGAPSVEEFEQYLRLNSNVYVFSTFQDHHSKSITLYLFENDLRSHPESLSQGMNTTTQSFSAADTTISLTKDDGNTDSLAGKSR